MIRAFLQRYHLQSPLPGDLRERISESREKVFMNITGRAMPGEKVNDKKMESESRGGKKMKGRYTLPGLAAAAIIVITATLVIKIQEKGSEGPGSGARMTVLFAIGDVSVKRGETDFRKLTPKESLNREDLVRTGENSTAVLQLSGRGILRISQKSMVRLSGLSMKSVELSLKKGGIFSKLEKLEKGDKFQVTTPTQEGNRR